MEPCRVILIQPWFGGDSFWNYRVTCEMAGAKYPAPPLHLATVAAMLPQHWDLRIIDENVEDLTQADFDGADLVLAGGMLPQRYRLLAVIEQAKAAGKPILVGGPDVSSSPHVYEAADFRMIGEAEGAMDAFLAAWEGGESAGTFEAPKHSVDITKTPVPRYDLLKKGAYIEYSLQFSRGCPFLCEFCDIIELFGRKPRIKTTEQILGELDAIYATGHRGLVDFVDDNLIGNKKAVKAVLPHIIEWQKARGYPFLFTTEASLNLADDPAFMELMRAAKFTVIFVGIESPDPDVLIATQKKQNTKRDIAESVKAIYGAGIAVVGGFIVGFDNEKVSVADDLVDLIEDAAIPVAMAGLLVALPTTQLERRLEAEGRLHTIGGVVDPDALSGDQCTAGLNFDTLRPREDVLGDYRNVIARIYTPRAFFGRIRKLVDLLDMSGVNGKLHLASFWAEASQFIRLVWNVTLKRPDMRGELWGLIFYILRRNPGALTPAISLAAIFAHLGPFSQHVLKTIDERIENEAGTDGRTEFERQLQQQALTAAE
ncbi:MAG: B12-binding domain-containing radical SAM protein [Pseudomonadota bacterium]